AHAARDRAVRMFSPEVVFPRYLEAMATATRRPLPTTWTFVRLAVRGFPVIGISRTARSSAPASAAVRRTGAAGGGPSRIGWVTYHTFQKPRKDLRELDSFTGMRAGNIARWINANSDRCRHEIYDPQQSYDAVIFQKMMNRRCQREVVRLQASGTAV